MNFTELKQRVKQSDNIVFLGGAGTSTESGIPDFRSNGGLYASGNGQQYAPEEILSHDFFMKQTEQFYDFYKSKMLYPDAKPNLAHEALAELEKRKQLKAVITQNIDGLHQMAGSDRVLELHGSVLRNFCMQCGAGFSLDDIMNSSHRVPTCDPCGGIIKPDVVLYQEQLDTDLLMEASSLIADADVLIVAGTSLTVQPAAGLVRSYQGDCFVMINLTPTPFDGFADYVISDKISKVLNAFI